MPKNSKPIRVLQIIADFKKGGIQAEVMFPARILSHEDVHFDVMLFTNSEEFYEAEFKQLGNIYRIPLKRESNKIKRALSVFSNFYYVYKEMLRFLRDHETYDAVHSRHWLLNAPCVMAAQKANVPVRIAYCGVNKPTKQVGEDRLYVKVYLWLCAKVLKRDATHRFGITQNAADYVFGKGNGNVIKSPVIDLDKYNPDRYFDKTTDTIRLIMVGSYSTRKNQRYAVDVLESICKVGRECTLTYIGYPRSNTEDYLPKLKAHVTARGLNEKVSFLPQDTDVAEALAHSDAMLIPSLQEGLPNVALEAQAMGVPCFISDNVSNDCDCGLCTFLSLESGSDAWASSILSYIEKSGKQKHHIDMSPWDNKKICAEYLEMWKGN